MAGQRLGRYQIIQEIGAGGMGVVFRARDEQLERDVAIKVLHLGSFGDETARSRFRKEARVLSRLNHPNIEVIYDFGTENGVDFVVMELVPGVTLSDKISVGPLPEKEVARIGLQLAQGLAAAHDAGVVHCDLKPANVRITPDGIVKLLDFGLAKLLRLSDTELTASLPQAKLIEGTLPYMAPEQLQGGEADARTDIYAAGAVLYEMATAKRPYPNTSAPALVAAILQTKPAPPSAVNREVSPGLDNIINKALDKDPDRRYQSSRELRVDLERLALPGMSERVVGPVRLPQARRGLSRALHRVGNAAWAFALLVLALVLAVGWWLYRANVSGPDFSQADFRRLTFNRGGIDTARCVGECDTVVYEARWSGGPPELYITRTDQPESRSLGPNTRLLGVSSQGELAIVRNFEADSLVGTLAAMPVLGGITRDLLKGVQWADWSPDGENLAVDHCLRSYTGLGEDAKGECRIEYPIGHVLVKPAGNAFLTHVRVSPKGDRVAFLYHPDPDDDLGSVVVSDLAGNQKTISQGWTSVWGLAWERSGDRLWYTASEDTEHGPRPRALYVSTLSSKPALALRESGQLTLYDVARDGRILLSRDTTSTEVIQHFQDGSQRDLAVQNFSKPVEVSRNGSFLLLLLMGEASGKTSDVYIRRLADSAPFHLGDGVPYAISPDNKWVLVGRPYRPKTNENSQLFQVPIGPGEAEQITHDNIARENAAYWPGGRHITFNGAAPGQRIRTWIQGLSGNSPRPLTSEGTVQVTEVSPDGRWFVAQAPDQTFWLYAQSGEHLSFPALHAGEIALRWSNDSRSVFVADREGLLRAKVFRVNVATGQRTLIYEISPNDPAGAYLDNFVIAADGSFYVSCYMHNLKDLFLVSAKGRH